MAGGPRRSTVSALVRYTRSLTSSAELEEVRVDVDEHGRAVAVVVGVDGELLALDDLLDHEALEVQHLLRVERAERLDLALDLGHRRRPRRRRLDHVHAQAEEAHGGLDDEGRAQARRVERAQLAQWQTGVAVVGIEVGHAGRGRRPCP